MSIVWKIKEGRYSNTSQGYIGKYLAFEVFHDGMANRNTTKFTALRCKLFGIKEALPNQSCEKEAKEYAEKVLTQWLKNTGLGFI